MKKMPIKKVPVKSFMPIRSERAMVSQRSLASSRSNFDSKSSRNTGVNDIQGSSHLNSKYLKENIIESERTFEIGTKNLTI